jgi:leucyl-tRNA synthetase
MELTNAILKARQAGGDTEIVEESIDTLLLLLAPMAPHLAAEAFDQRHGRHIHEEPWPTFDDTAIAEATVTLVVQVDGKLRDRIEVASDISEADAIALASASEKVRELLGDTEPVRIIARPPNLVNIVTRGR